MRLNSLIIVCLALFVSLDRIDLQAAEPKKIALIAGSKDPGHPAGTHEYERNVRLIKYGLETSPNLRGVKCEVILNGWPKDEKILDTVDSIVLISSGGDRRLEDHPMLVGERMKVLEKQMARGCGLVTFHWSTHTPTGEVGEKILEWVGGHFDFGDVAGKGKTTWKSAISTVTFDCKLGTADHPISRGVLPFRVKEEFYYQLKFREKDERLKPILIVNGPNVPKDQTVGWAVERKDGGRGFGFTGGHFFANWSEPNFRRLVMNAVVWSAKLEIPVGGVITATLPDKMYDLEDPAIADWTPKPMIGKGEAWERKNDPEWDDDRFLKTDTGPFFDATFGIPGVGDKAYVYKGLAVRLQNGGAIFDRVSCNWATTWTGSENGRYLKHSNKRYSLMNTPEPNGQIQFIDGTKKLTRPMEGQQYLGMYRHGERITVKYRLGEATFLETVRNENGQIIRTQKLNNEAAKIVALSPTAANNANASVKPDDLDALTKPGNRIFGEPIIMPIARGPDDGPFRVDTMIIPFDNRFNAMMFLTSLEHLPDGRIAVTTAHGDVWLVTVDDAKNQCSWQRFAAGLYHPFGLKLVDGKLIVLERGQLTRLHDENNDGEADYFECVCNNWDTGHGTHSYDTGLETDPDGNFYVFKTGDTNLPTGGTLLKISKDFKKVDVFTTGHRHPIGMGVSPKGIVTGADQEGNWMPASRIDQYKQSGFYGDMRAHHRSTPPAIYDGPLCWVPREVDNSSAGQVWVPEDAKGWGALAGLPLHLSYGRCKAFVLFRQELPDGRVQGGVCDTGIRFNSGSTRGRFAKDGSLYVVGLTGWQTAAQQDGCLQRVVPTGQEFYLPVKLEAKRVVDAARGNLISPTIRLTFNQPIDAASVAVANFQCAAWGYRWHADYGSKRFKLSNPQEAGEDTVVVSKATLVDANSVELQLSRGIDPVQQLQIGFTLKAKDGKAIKNVVYSTVHSWPVNGR